MRLDPAIVYTTGHALNEQMSAVLARGFGANKRQASIRAVKDGEPQFVPVNPTRNACAISYGILRGTGHILKECERIGADYLYCDHSYFKASRANLSRPTDRDHFRLVPNDRYFRESVDMPSDRWESLGIELKPWRTSGEHIVVVPVSKFLAAYHGFDPQEWLKETVSEVRKHTDRQIVVKPKDSDKPIEAVLENAWALVTLESNAAIDAVLAGIPAFTGVSAAAAPFGCQDLSLLETPPLPDREQHLANLAYQQWTVQELKSGQAKTVLQQQFGSTGGLGIPAERQECRSVECFVPSHQ